MPIRKLTPLLAFMSTILVACAIGVEDDLATNERPYDDDALDASVEEASELDASIDGSLPDGFPSSDDADIEVGEGGCTPSEIETLGPCGQCGTLERECQDDGSFGDAECKSEGACVPDTIDSRPCGNCGTQTRGCTNSCEWEPWSECEGQGVCMPGEVGEASECADECFAQTRTCLDTCEWGPCNFEAGAECERKGGSNWQCCGQEAWQFCLSTCKWAPCQSCGASCPNACR